MHSLIKTLVSGELWSMWKMWIFKVLFSTTTYSMANYSFVVNAWKYFYFFFDFCIKFINNNHQDEVITKYQYRRNQFSSL